MKEEWAQSFYESWVDNVRKDGLTSGASQFELFKNEQFKKLMEAAPGTILIVNHPNFSYEFFSENVRNMLGYTSQELIEGGVAFGMSLFEKGDADLYTNIFLPLLFEKMRYYADRNELKKVKFIFCFKMIRKDGVVIWCQEDMSIMEADDNGLPLLSMYFLTEITSIKKDETIHFSVLKQGEDGYYYPEYYHSYPDTSLPCEFTGRESQILSLLNNGKTSKDIAKTLNLSTHTINTHRRNMLEKTGTKNTIELLKVAVVKGFV